MINEISELKQCMIYNAKNTEKSDSFSIECLICATDFDENDPQSTAKMLRIWKEAMGENIGPQGEELQAYQDIADITSEFESGSLDSL